ncbi:MAG TPA: hypothetical protein VN325_21325 [Steroidobacteraceae bacterium]|nr:hypothetical protein [Steroidobacteraceae bacterium]
MTSEPAFALDPLDRIAVAYLTLPLAIFLLGWFEWWVAVPLVVCMAYSLRPSLGARAATSPTPTAIRVPVTSLQLTVAVIVGCGWTLLGGTEHLVFANADWHIRDAVLHDLVVSPWPVGYGLLDGKETLLRAPVAFYLPPALVGKVLGLATAHVVMGIWTATGATLFLLQVLSLTPSRLRVALTVSAVVVLFSGLDIIGSLLNDGPRFRYDWNITTHIEWWAGKYQYSSMTTQLFWVPNHAFGGWLAIGLLSRHPRSTQLNLLLPIVVVAAALWSPLTALGLMPFVLWRVAADSWRERSWRLVNPLVWAPATAIGLVISAYFVLDPSRVAKGMAVGRHDDLVMDLLQQAQFFLLEAGFIGAAILVLHRSSQVALALVILALLPLVYLGPGNDLVMRASIPSLAILTIASCLALIEPVVDKRRLRYKAVLVGLLVIGAVTPVEEIARAVLLPSWPVNTTATLIGADCGHFSPHYVARVGDEEIGRLMRPTHRVPLGPQGPASCSNPAFELMWSWGFFPREKLRPLVSVRGKPGNS